MTIECIFCFQLGNSSSPRISQPTRSHRKVDNVENHECWKECQNIIDWITSYGSTCISLWPLHCSSKIKIFCCWKDSNGSGIVSWIHFTHCNVVQCCNNNCNMLFRCLIMLLENRWAFLMLKNGLVPFLLMNHDLLNCATISIICHECNDAMLP